MGDVLSRRGFVDLRRAATLNHCYPTLRTRIGLDGTTLIEVGGDPGGAPEGAVRSDPCAFRSAVVAAWSNHLVGQPMQVLDLPTDPDIDVTPVLGGAVLAGGILRTPLVDRHSYLLTTTFALEGLPDGPRAALQRVAALGQVFAVGCLRDADTDITIIHVDVGRRVDPDDEATLLDRLHDVTAGLVTAELLAELATSRA